MLHAIFVILYRSIVRALASGAVKTRFSTKLNRFGARLGAVAPPSVIEEEISSG
jgi:hypothetical protein